MRFDKSKKSAIIRYLLEKMDDGVPNVVKLVSETFEINQNTVHTYIKELLSEGVIERVKRGTYTLLDKTTTHFFSKSKGEIEDEQEIYEKYLRQHFQEFPVNVRGIWDYILGEMINNVIDHSGAENLEILVKQNYLFTKVCIFDDGIGIFKKIKEHFNMSSLDEAICELFKGKLTTDPENHSGEGIFFSSRLADRFAIFSDGKIFSINKYDIDNLWDDPEPRAGTAVIIELSNESNKKAEEVFNQYTQVDGGFSRTMVPLKNLFETAPVSRSQAKRVCLRLEKFREVVLDFEGLDWMGQGFAHQIFIVFRNKHPDVELIPINMSKGVEQMYLHVTGRTYE